MLLMKKLKINNKKNIIILFFLILLLIIWNIPKNYNIDYKINDYIINESYDKKGKIYTFYINKDNKIYPFKIKSKYYHSKVINNIDFIINNNISCLFPQSKKIKFGPLCLKDSNLISYETVKNEEIFFDNYSPKIDYIQDSYNKINMYYLNNKRYLIWNYKGFYSINNKYQEIKLFEDDIYNIDLTYQLKDKLIIANYANKYNIDKFYVIDKKNKVKEIKISKDISFDSYFLGDYKNKLYLFDRKNKKEYVIDINKKTIEEITKKDQGKILKDGKWENISVNKLSNSDYKFEKNNIEYQIIEGKLYQIIDEYKILISNNEVKYIVKIDEDSVYYISIDSLYVYNNLIGEVKLLDYFEWNFNYQNMIYIF